MAWHLDSVKPPELLPQQSHEPLHPIDRNIHPLLDAVNIEMCSTRETGVMYIYYHRLRYWYECAKFREGTIIIE